MTEAITHVPGQGFFIDEAGERLAEMTYDRAGEHVVVIDHTWVSPTLRGRGIARKLLNELVSWARETGTKVTPVCSYAVAEFQKDASIGDVLSR